ncbi:MAG: plastocyanin/azurin family copper-binding protein [Dehalococcoidia bacterium]
MRKFKSAVAIGAAALAIVLAGCSGGGSSAPAGDGSSSAVTLQMQDIKYDKTALTATKGQTLTITLNNTGALDHDFTIDKIEGAAKFDGKDPKADNVAIKALLKAKASGKLEITPAAAGTYDFYCSVPGHKDAGMKGKLTVN